MKNWGDEVAQGLGISPYNGPGFGLRMLRRSRFAFAWSWLGRLSRFSVFLSPDAFWGFLFDSRSRSRFAFAWSWLVFTRVPRRIGGGRRNSSSFGSCVE
jgi:hypothetical protein